MVNILGVYGGTLPPSTTPINTVAPMISGTAEQGGTITVTPGTWTGAGAITGEWLVNDVSIGETGTTYVVGALTDGDLITYRESTGGVTATSNALTFTASSSAVVAPTNLQSSIF